LYNSSGSISARAENSRLKVFDFIYGVILQVQFVHVHKFSGSTMSISDFNQKICQALQPAKTKAFSPASAAVARPPDYMI